MIGIKEAASAAESFAKELLDGDLVGLQLEEVELSEDDKNWRITLGWVDPMAFHDPLNPAKGLARALTGYRNLPRVYKTFIVDADSGQVRAMKIRET